jgi:hypothetical protein
MASKNIQMKNKNGVAWDDLFPKTKSFLVTMNDASTVEDTIASILTSVATKQTLAQVQAEIQKVIGSAPAVLDTLQELATALGNDPNFATTITTSLGNKVDKITGKQLSTEDFTTALLTKLNSVAANANNYVHPTGDGNLHVPVTSTTNSGKFMRAGSTAGALTWAIPAIAEIASLQIELDKRAKITVSPTDPTTANADFWFAEV